MATEKTFSLKTCPIDAEILVRCAYDEYVCLSALISHPANPNSHPPEQIALIWKVIKTTGWRRPVRVSTRSGLVTSGHGAMLAARFGGCLGAPVDYQDYDDEEQELEDLHADNFLQELSYMDPQIVRQNLDELRKHNKEYDIERLGTLVENLADKIGASLAELNVAVGAQQQAKVPTPSHRPIAAKMHESYEYLVVITTNVTDEQFLRNLIGARIERSAKKNVLGLGHVIHFERFMENLRKNHHLFLPKDDKHVDSDVGK